LNERTRRRSCWPTEEQKLLLKAAMLDGEAGDAALRTLAVTVDLDRLDWGSYRLLPLIYRRLSDRKVAFAEMDQLRGLYRRAFYSNQCLFGWLARLIEALSAEGLDCLVLKGVPLALSYYASPALRPMDDADLMVRVEDAARAMDLVVELGWRPVQRDPWRLIPLRHATDFQRAGGEELDLHWRALLESGASEEDEAFWRDAVPLSIGSACCLTLSPTHQLLHTCLHGAVWNPVAPLRWLTDALQICQTAADQIDWSELCTRARARAAVLPVRETLRYVADELGGPVPEAALDQLDALDVSALERIEYAAMTRRSALLGRLPQLVFQYMRVSRGSGGWLRARGLAEFLRNEWDLEGVNQVPAAILRKGLDRAGRRLGLGGARP